MFFLLGPLILFATISSSWANGITAIVNPMAPIKMFNPPCSFSMFHMYSKKLHKVCPAAHVKDHFGLCSPCSWDCNMGVFGKLSYENYMPSRRFECSCYCMDADSKWFPVDLERTGSGKDTDSTQIQRGRADKACSVSYVVDDEMEQTIATLQSVNVKTKHFTVVEIGSRQGQWALKAVQLAKVAGDFTTVYGYSVEMLELWKARQREKLELNHLQDMVNISSALITHKNYAQMITELTMRTGTWQPINHMDWDCQGCEGLLASAEAFKLFEDNVLSIFIAVHGKKNALALNKFYKHIAMVNIDGMMKSECETANIEALAHDRGFVDIKNTCLRDTAFGPVYYRDGTLRVFNKKLYDKLQLPLRLTACVPWEIENRQS